MTQTIHVGPSARSAIDELRSGIGPARVVFDTESCDGLVFEMLAMHNALAASPRPTTAVIRGVASLIGPSGAQRVDVEGGSFVRVAPLTMAVAGGRAAMESAALTLDKLTAVVLDCLTRRPHARAVLLGGEERFYSAEEAVRLGVADGIET